ncbi:acetylglutamate kinase [Bacillus mesophilus]|uniref:Acetylglutamate kinase n=1 Tax=Bacillus mesophilus TaxID=1808955 RepID=A0A6M0QAI9_9BACI|nr:acetylglutamate kinase [Bacillus mesophilus]MBM7662607.1 acetylglutamate kinase [Bacillus mesophilus]NEY73325.1 acetylglutamate kinase [Bacillus mesophilus]
MEYVVIKCGGSVMENLPKSFYENIVQLHQSGTVKPILVHGGGPLISSLLTKLGIETKFVNGLRVTTAEMLDLVEMVLSGTVNKQMVRRLIGVNGKAIGVSGVDGMLLKSEPTKDADQLGYVGEVVGVNYDVLNTILNAGHIPVVSPIGIDESGQRYNINGDVAASAVAKSLGAKLCMISDIPGIYTEQNGKKVTLKQVTKQDAEEMITDGVIAGGMIPKVKAAIDGLLHGIPEVVIINGMEPDSLLTFASGSEIGTKIVLAGEGQYVY